jgi:hypothetical protein
MNRRGGLTVDRDSLHASDGYKRQIDALRQLQQDKPMKDELRKAVERALVRMEHDDPQGVRYVRQALRDQEAEIAEWSGRALREQTAHHEAAKRAMKAEALLREIYARGYDMRIHDRIATHLGAQHD